MPRPLALSVADWLVPWRARPWPIDWARELGRDAPLALEIGFGNGAFLEREARRRPDRNHVGIELSWTAATHLFRRLDKGGAPHVRALLADAEVALEHLFPPAALAEVFVNHPCPWPKDRHAARRLIRPEVLRLLAARMAPDAPLLIVTDHAAYAREIAAHLEAQSDLAPRHGATEVDALPGREPTKYERKALAAGERIHYFAWVRRGGAVQRAPAPSPPPTEMPSLTLTGDVAPAELFRGFSADVETLEHRGVPTVVKLVAAYRREDGERPAWLVEALVKEDRLRQDFAIEVAARAPGAVRIKLGSLGEPHPTFGAKRAVWRVGAWLRRAHPGLAPGDHTLGDAAGDA